MDREQDQTKDVNVGPPEAEQMRPSHASPGGLLEIPFTLPLLLELLWKMSQWTRFDYSFLEVS